MANSRSKNVVLNIIIGFVVQIAIMLLAFIGRRIFVRYLSLDYLGINGLYGNILSVLALAELGLGNVTQFFLYKPVVEHDEKRIASLMKYFRKLYTIIALVVLVIGVSLTPFLKYIVDTDLSQRNMIIYYIIFLLNSVVTYFSADKIALLAANQDNRLQKYVMLVLNLVFQFVHIAVLIIWHSYIIYVLMTLLNSVINVIVLNCICDYRYPYAKISNAEELDDSHRKYIINNIKSTFIYKIGAVIVNNTDNILISVIVSTAAVGLYSNYYMVVAAVQTFISIITSALISGVGNLSAEGNTKKMLDIFNMMLLLYHIIAGYGAISFFFLFKELIPFWLGTDYLMDQKTVFAISLNFYITNATSPIWMFRESNGLFSKVKYLMITTAGCNIMLSIVLGRLLGVFGVLFATSISRIITQVWYEPHILFNSIFDKSAKYYWLCQGKYFAIVIISAVICFYINKLMLHSVVFIVVKAIIYLLVILLVVVIMCHKSSEVKSMISYIKYIKNKVIKKGRT